MTTAGDLRDRRSAWMAAALCAGLLLVYLVVGLSAKSSKSATFDEPLEGLGAWVGVRYHDYRLVPENPPLWQYWASLPLGKSALDVKLDGPQWDIITQDITQRYAWTVHTLYRTSGNDPEWFIGRMRFMMALAAAGLGGLIGWWAWRLGGAIAAVAATALFALDPNFLAHGPLMKNDVPFALGMFALVYATWRTGRRASWWSVLSVALLAAAAVNIKLSALILGPLVAMLLIGRAFLGGPWECLGRTLRSWWSRLLAVGGIGVVCLATCWIVTWACYGFRFSTTAPGSPPMKFDEMIHLNEISGHPADSSIVAASAWMERHRILPQAWIYGLLYQNATTVARRNFILGHIQNQGVWYYFPFAMLVKTPLGTMAALVMGLAGGLWLAFKRGIWRRWNGWWITICLMVPVAYYMLFAMRGNLNLGLRHVLSVYPFLFVAAGVVAAKLWRLRPSSFGPVLMALGIALAAETGLAYPDYIPFFNSFAGGSRGGLNLLGDSNLDWGQDLPALADWQRKHPEIPLYLSYFGIADPAYYGIDYINMPQGYPWGPPIEVPKKPGVIAVSATSLQGIYMPEDWFKYYTELRQAEPLDVLHGSIYLFAYNLSPAQLSRLAADGTEIPIQSR
ncbi:MAG: hypothetical protein IT447_05585 [Phycisphaerales bacterium]|nr:hypothetical protein [Phycisphaerales bacterium]